MKKIEISATTNLVGCKVKNIIEVEDHLTDEDIEKIALDYLFDSLIEWNWREVD